MFQDLIAGAKPFCVILEWATPDVRRTTAEALVPKLQNHDEGTSHFEGKFQKTPALEVVLEHLRKRESLVISTPEKYWEAASEGQEIGSISHLTVPLRASFEKIPEAY